ncbi:MAG: hypothetical protein ACTSU5_14095 [Promethearchaeota archaeon]
MNSARKTTTIALVLLLAGLTLLAASFLCFHALLPGPMTCGSPCEQWWSWVVDFPPTGICIALCQPRNALYRPLFVAGSVFVASALCLLGRVALGRGKRGAAGPTS